MSLLGSQLSVGDYVQVHDVWYKITRTEDGGTRQVYRYVGVDKKGGRRHLAIYSSRTHKAYKAAR